MLAELRFYLRRTILMLTMYFSVFDPIESPRDFDYLVWAWLTEEE